MREKPIAGTFYKHFKGNIYQIKMIAKESETEKEMVVYQAMYPPFQYWVRPVEEFLSETDQKKYPDALQRYRFEKVEPDGNDKRNMGNHEGFRKDTNQTGKREEQKTKNEEKETQNEEVVEVNERQTKKSVEVNEEEWKAAILSGQAEKKLSGKLTEREIAQRGFMDILDADTYHEKRLLLIGLKDYLNDVMLSNIAVSLDLVLEEGDAQSHYDAILFCLQKLEEYEVRRLR